MKNEDGSAVVATKVQSNNNTAIKTGETSSSTVKEKVTNPSSVNEKVANPQTNDNFPLGMLLLFGVSGFILLFFKNA